MLHVDIPFILPGLNELLALTIPPVKETDPLNPITHHPTETFPLRSSGSSLLLFMIPALFLTLEKIKHQFERYQLEGSWAEQANCRAATRVTI